MAVSYNHTFSYFPKFINMSTLEAKILLILQSCILQVTKLTQEFRTLFVLGLCILTLKHKLQQICEL